MTVEEYVKHLRERYEAAVKRGDAQAGLACLKMLGQSIGALR